MDGVAIVRHGMSERIQSSKWKSITIDWFVCVENPCIPPFFIYKIPCHGVTIKYQQKMGKLNQG